MTDTWAKVLANGGPPNTVETLRAHLERLKPTRDALESLPDCIVHGDFRAQNLIYKDQQIVAILDLDGVCRAPRIYDLAYAVVFFKAVVDPHPPSMEEIGEFLNGYHRAATLIDKERHCLPAAIGFSLLKGLSLWMDLAYVSRVNGDLAATWIDAYLPLIGRIEDYGELVF
jgi:Ser/Thr protein kinase RdoA (MazF antagonist)